MIGDDLPRPVFRSEDSVWILLLVGSDFGAEDLVWLPVGSDFLSEDSVWVPVESDFGSEDLVWVEEVFTLPGSSNTPFWVSSSLEIF